MTDVAALKTALIIIIVGIVAIIAVKLIEAMQQGEDQPPPGTADLTPAEAEHEAWQIWQAEQDAIAEAARLYVAPSLTPSQEIQAAVIERGCYTGDEKFWAYRYDRALFDWMRTQKACW